MRALTKLSLLLVLAISAARGTESSFESRVQPLLKKHCFGCHGPDEMKSGIRVDRLDALGADKDLRLWEEIEKQLADEVMPPDDEPQPTAEERVELQDWIQQLLVEARSREAERNGSIRRLTVAQYQTTLSDLLGLEEDFTALLPPDAVSKDGFLNNEQTMLLSPLLLEAYFEVAERALDRCIVDVDAKPTIQNFRMDLGKAINTNPLDPLILGALNRLLPNSDFEVTELTSEKSFAFESFRMQTKLRFIEGYAGNSTVRGWREYDSIYHVVFACMRGSAGYPRGNPYDLVPDGLLLRPAIPSAELFKVESTYGPKANFKVSLRELPDSGKFRITVRAAKYDDGLLLDQTAEPIGDGITVRTLTEPEMVVIDQAGIYQVEVYPELSPRPKADASRLDEGQIGAWNFDDGPADSPFGKAASIQPNAEGVVVIPREESMNVGQGEFSVAAWIRPSQLRQGGIVTLGPYGQRGWVFDMPTGNGILRIETFSNPGQRNGTVQSKPGVIRKGQWQHVAAVVKRGENQTRLFYNGYEVAVGTVNDADLDNPNVDLHIGRVPGANVYAGEIDEVRIYRRALDAAEIQALVEPGAEFDQPPPAGKSQLTLKLGDRQFSGILDRAPFVAVRLPAGPLEVLADYAGQTKSGRIVFAPMKNTEAFERFEKRSPQLGVHLGLRRDCGSTLNRIGNPRPVSQTELTDFVFEGAIADFPSPDVEKNNVNYISGLREIGVRSEFTDGREMPRLRIRSVEFEGPFYETWPPKTHRNIFVSGDPREIIRNFATRAFRRPVTPAELTSFHSVYEDSFASSLNFEKSIEDALLVILTSPQFLFLIESSDGPHAEDLNDFELASKLAYFLWNAPADQQLLALAAKNELRASLDSQIDRLIADPRFSQFIEEFAAQWLSLEKFEIVEFDRKKFPRLTRDTKTQLREEPVRFLEHLIRENLPLRNLIQSDFIVANETVAAYYDLAERSESGFAFASIRHDDENLGGLLSQAGILAGLSNGRESNPVKRGAWLARKIIAEPPADPPPNVPALDEEDHTLTLREKLERHRNQEGCAKCHEGIDPWGLPFEQFDAGGRFLKADNIAASSTLPDKTEIGGIGDLKAYLSGERIDQVAFSFTKHLATYAAGRELTYRELAVLREESSELSIDDYRMADLVRWVVQSEIFLKK
ncbi:MAG: hypothetical protein ACI8UO_005080 [Verrucomicrobiales bacterium]|jgi:hypothetical protein